MEKTIDWAEYRVTPEKLVGMPLDEAAALLNEKGFQYGISSIDGVSRINIAIVQILLKVENGIVVQTELDGKVYVKVAV